MAEWSKGGTEGTEREGREVIHTIHLPLPFTYEILDQSQGSKPNNRR